MTMVVNIHEMKKLREENISKLVELEQRYKHITNKKHLHKLTPVQMVKVLYFTEKIESFEQELKSVEQLLN